MRHLIKALKDIGAALLAIALVILFVVVVAGAPYLLLRPLGVDPTLAKTVSFVVLLIAALTVSNWINEPVTDQDYLARRNRWPASFRPRGRRS